MKNALIIRHAAPETLGANFVSILGEEGFRLDALNLFNLAPTYLSFPQPDLGRTDLIVALGGPLSANDDYPALEQERELFIQAYRSGIPIFAVCLGAQLLCRALGGQVRPTGGYQFGLRKLSVTAAGDSDPVFGKIRVPLVPTLHGECFSIPEGATPLAEGHIMLRDGRYAKINMAFRAGNCYAFQFEPQLTYDELVMWNREMYDDYLLMGDNFDPTEEAARNLREFAKFAPIHEAQMGDMLRAFLVSAGLSSPSAHSVKLREAGI